MGVIFFHRILNFSIMSVLDIRGHRGGGQGGAPPEKSPKGNPPPLRSLP